MNKVLIALDYDPTAQKVAENGFAIANAMNAEIVLMHVMADPIYYASSIYTPLMGFGGYVGMDFLEPDILKALKDESHNYLNKVKLYLKDPTIQAVITSGNIAESIINTATNINASVIVIGSHSRRWLESILLGSIAEKVLHHSTLPLLIIPTKNHKQAE